MAGKTAQRAEKSASEIQIVKRAQESLVGFPMGEIDAGADPPDCVIEDSVSGTCCAVEVTETIIKQSREIKARGWKRSESFAVRLVHETLVGTRLDTGWFKEVFIHQADHPSYAISCKDGLVREVPNRTADVPGDP